MTYISYYPQDSVIHRLDSRVKILLSILFLTVVLISKSFYGNIVSFIFLAVVIHLSKVPVNIIIKGFKGFGILFLFAGIMNIFFNPGGTVYFEFYFLKITSQGILYSIRIMFRLFMLIIASAMLTYTTQILDFAQGLNELLEPLKKIKFPAHEVSMIITIALRFIPTIMTELEKIKKAQMSRGADFQTGNLIKRIRGLIPFLIPVFVASFKRANELAIAMESRGYRGDINRSKMKNLKMARGDFFASGVFLVYVVCILVVRYTIERGL